MPDDEPNTRPGAPATVHPTVDPTVHPTVHRASAGELSVADAHDLWQLRSAVFVVEQDCPYLDLDGRDLEPGTEHLWVRDDHGVAACARVLRDDAATGWIGRIVTRADARGRGLAATLLHAGIDHLRADGITSIRLGAQAHLAEYYERFGFVVDGHVYVEDGIPHLPMVLDAATAKDRS